ncbi:MAG: hypothetical protein QOF48_3022 [Verrucomicrobiota bacterium]|jgi:hypothetical protein
MNRSRAHRWICVVAYAVAMAWVEAAVVFYLRKMVHRIEPYQSTPLPEFGGIGPTEMVREFATMLMLLTVGWLAGETRRARLGYCLLAFGTWDIFYYVFLKLITGWPGSLLDWDLLFLLPLPWWGPVMAPVGIALLLILWGTAVTQFGPAFTGASKRSWAFASMGAATALVVFMLDSSGRAGERGDSECTSRGISVAVVPRGAGVDGSAGDRSVAPCSQGWNRRR